MRYVWYMVICLAVVLPAPCAPAADRCVLAPPSAFESQRDAGDEEETALFVNSVFAKLEKFRRNGVSPETFSAEWAAFFDDLTLLYGDKLIQQYEAGTENVRYVSLSFGRRDILFRYATDERVEIYEGWSEFLRSGRPAEIALNIRALSPELFLRLVRETVRDPSADIAQLVVVLMAERRSDIQFILKNIQKILDFLIERDIDGGILKAPKEGIDALVREADGDSEKQIARIVDILDFVIKRIKVTRRLDEGGKQRFVDKFVEFQKMLEGGKHKLLCALALESDELHRAVAGKLDVLAADSRGEVRAAAAEIRQMIRQSHLAQLQSMMRLEKNQRDVRHILDKLAQVASYYPGDGDTATVLTEAFFMDIYEVRSEALKLLTEMRAAGALQSILSKLEGRADYVNIKLDVIRALSSTAEPQVFSALFEVFEKSKDGDSQKAAGEGLVLLLKSVRPDARTLAEWERRVSAYVAPRKAALRYEERKIAEELLRALVQSRRDLELAQMREKGEEVEKLLQVTTVGRGYTELIFSNGKLFVCRERPDGKLYVDSHYAGTFEPVRADSAEYARVVKALREERAALGRSSVGWDPRGELISVFTGPADLQERMRKEFAACPPARDLAVRAIQVELARKEGKKRYTDMDSFIEFLTSYRVRDDDRPVADRVVIETAQERILIGFDPRSKTILPRLYSSLADMVAGARETPAGELAFKTATENLDRKFGLMLGDAGVAHSEGDFKKVWNELCGAFPVLIERGKAAGAFDEKTASLYWARAAREPGPAQFDEFVSRILGFGTGERSALERELVETDPAYAQGKKALAYRRGMIAAGLRILAAREALRERTVRMAVSHELFHYVHSNVMGEKVARELREYLLKSGRLAGAADVLRDAQLTGTGELFIDESGRKFEPALERELFATMFEYIVYGDNAIHPSLRPTFADLHVLREKGLITGNVPADILRDLKKKDLLPVQTAGDQNRVLNFVRRALAEKGTAAAREIPRDAIYEVPFFADGIDAIRLLCLLGTPGNDIELAGRSPVEFRGKKWEVVSVGSRLPDGSLQVVFPDCLMTRENGTVMLFNPANSSLYRIDEYGFIEGEHAGTVYVCRVFPPYGAEERVAGVALKKNPAEVVDARIRALLANIVRFDYVLAAFIDVLGTAVSRQAGLNIKQIDEKLGVAAVDRDFSGNAIDKMFRFSPARADQQKAYFLALLKLYRQLRQQQEEGYAPLAFDKEVEKVLAATKFMLARNQFYEDMKSLLQADETAFAADLQRNLEAVLDMVRFKSLPFDVLTPAGPRPLSDEYTAAAAVDSFS